jgi:hypothetical protein
MTVFTPTRAPAPPSNGHALPAGLTTTRITTTTVVSRLSGRSSPLTDIALLAVTLAAGLGAARLTRAPSTAHVLWPIAACVIVGYAVTTVVRLLRVPDPVPSVAGIVAVALTSVWTLLPRATLGGLPTATTVRVLLHSFSAAGTVIRSNPTPVPATTGVVLCLAAGAGLAAVFARTLWNWQEARPEGTRRPLVALFPSFGLFCYTALLSSDIDRVTGATVYLATALVFLAVADRPTVSANRPSVWWPSGTTTALALAVIAIVVPVVASPGLGGLKLDAIPFSRGGGIEGPGGTGSGSFAPAGVGPLNLIDSMRSVLTSSSDVVMFTATSPKATYWQLATLTHFNGNAWLPDQPTRAAARSAPELEPTTLPILVGPPAVHTFTIRIAIGDLRSTLLPVPPNVVSVNDAAVVQVEPGIGVVQPFASPADLTYGATSIVPAVLGKTAEPTMAALDHSIPVGDLPPYLTLPKVPARVVALAHQLVKNVHGPAAQAAALVRFFTQGKRFRYTLTPPPVVGSDALSSFLFSTRAGFCQQFAGAFAVLARIDGLPTRLAVGFTTGTVVKKNTFAVTGADAHSWPQVYLGPDAGWVSFEPTPATTDEPSGAGIQGGVPTTIATKPAHRTSTTLAFPKPRTGPNLTPTPNGVGLLTKPTQPTVTHPASWAPLYLALGLVVLVVAGVLAGPWLWRRRRVRLRRRRFARGHAPDAEILARWEQASSVLARTGLGRRESETIEEHAARLTRVPTRPTPAAALFTAVAGPVPEQPTATDLEGRRALEAYRDLAALAARASYAADPCTAEDVAEARRLSDALRQALRQGAPVAGAGTARP